MQANSIIWLSDSLGFLPVAQLMITTSLRNCSRVGCMTRGPQYPASLIHPDAALTVSVETRALNAQTT